MRIYMKKYVPYIFKIIILCVLLFSSYNKNTPICYASGYSDILELTINISAFSKPVASFSCPNRVVRDQDGPGGKKVASIDITDLSYTYGSETILKRIYSYVFDSNNDGSFVGETENIVSTRNETRETIDNLTQVGKYQIKETVEKYIPASKTIPEFFDVSTYVTIDGMLYIEWSSEKCNDSTSYVVEVINTAPSASFDAVKKKKLDLVVLTDYSGTKLSDLTTKLNTYKANLNANNYDVSYNIVSGSTSIGTQNLTVNQPEYAFGVNLTYYKTGYTVDGPPEITRNYNYSYSSTLCNIKYCYGSNLPNISVDYYIQSYNYSSNGMFGGSDHSGTRYVFYNTSNPSENGSIDLDNSSRYNFWNTSCSIYGWSSMSYDNVGCSIRGWYQTGNSQTVQQNYTVNAVNVGNFPTPRQGSDTYMLFVSDSAATDFSTWGNYFPFGSLTNDTLKYAVSNNAKVYAVMPGAGLDILLRNNYSTNCNTQSLTVRQLLSTCGGAIYDTSQVQQALDNIKVLSAPTQAGNNNYVVVNEDTLTYTPHYTDYEGDLQEAARWKITHDPNVFENNEGLYSQSGKYQSSGLTTFSLPGKYDIEYQNQDKPTNNIRFRNYNLWGGTAELALYAHRRPVAQFAVTMTRSGSNYIPNVTESSFDLDHLSQLNKGIVQKRWQWKESCVSTWSDGMISSSLPQNREYDVKLLVQDAEGAWSMPNIQTIKTYGVNLPPTVDANPTTKDSGSNITVTITADDLGEYDFSNVKYLFSKSSQKPSSGWQTSYSKVFSTTLSGDGTYYLHIEAFDNQGASFYRMRGPYTINSLKISGVTIDGYWNHWRGQVDLFGKTLTNEPHRFLSLECVMIRVNTTGYADKVEIRFSPELEAMQYTDPYGNVYDYADDYFGYYVSFPKVFMLDGSKKDNSIYWEYYLPLAPITKDKDDIRIKQPYQMCVRVYKGSTFVEYLVDDIDITGNVYDHVYVQPLK